MTLDYICCCLFSFTKLRGLKTVNMVYLHGVGTEVYYQFYSDLTYLCFVYLSESENAAN